MLGPTPSGARRNPSRDTGQKSKSLPSIQENLENLHISDEHELSSPGYDPDAERKKERASRNNSTPESRKKLGSSTTSNQKKNARAADANDGQCLLTNLCEAINTCHIVAGATNADVVMKLEYAWGFPRGSFNLDTRHNLFFLRADWHFLFDQGKFILVPELSVLETLSRVTVDEAPEDRSRINLDKTFTRRHFKYHLLPMSGLKGPICRFHDSNNPGKHSTHYFPFATLGFLTSHVKPQYVVVNAAQRLRQLSIDDFAESQSVLKQVSFEKGRKKDTAATRLNLILRLYRRWTSLEIPDDFAQSAGGNLLDDADHPPSEQAPSATSQGDQSDDDDADSSDDSDEHSTPSKKSKHGRQHQDHHESTSSVASGEDTTLEDDAWSPSEETAWIEDICDWAKICDDTAASKGGWESSVLNEDDQVAAYAKESPRSAPPPESWHKWKPSWERREWQYPPFNTRKFSSNDWAVYEKLSYLTWSATF